MTAIRLFIVLAFLFRSLPLASAATYYVAQNNPNPTPPYASWATAATNIQDAINAATNGDQIWVTNGIYAHGGISMDGVITNRISVNKAILVESVNGPNVTIIQGAFDLTHTNGPGAIRCAWLTNNATLSGFTLTGGATRSGSGSSAFGGGVYGNSTNAMVYNCVITTNFAASGGGAYGATLSHRTLSGNQAIATQYGGGAYECNLLNCWITANVSPLSFGGGTAFCNATNCAYTQNSARSEGAAAYQGVLVNCTVSENTSILYGGAVEGATLVNCISYGNLSETVDSGLNYGGCTMTWCDSDPLPTGKGNRDANPQWLADGLHLAATSPCIGAGTNRVVSGTDIYGEPWNNPPSIGCVEWQPAPVVVAQPFCQVLPVAGGVAMVFVTSAGGQPPLSYSWSKDGTLIQTGPHYGSVSTASLVVSNFNVADAGAYQFVVSNAFGVATSQVAQVMVHAVSAAGTNPIAPYATWDTAATNIQDAVDAAGPGDVVIVTNGIYAHGGRSYNGGITNRVLVTQPQLAICSINGYAATVIQGAFDPNTTNGPLAVRGCFLAANNVSLTGFTLQGGATSGGAQVASNPDSNDNVGGGVASAGQPYPWNTVSFPGVSVNNCLIIANTAGDSGTGGDGGGAAYVNLDNCILTTNVAYEGGGAYNCQLTNCTVAGNAAYLFGGGTSHGNLYNCISFNNAGANGWENSFNPGQTPGISVPQADILYYSCTIPAASGAGTIDADPQFVDASFHLAATSPCLGTANPLYVSGVDIEGDPWSSPPSMGAQEVNPADFVGPLTVAIESQPPTFQGRPWHFTGQITGRAAGLTWNWGDGSTSTNVSYATTHIFTNAGAYTVTFTAFNNDNPAGVSTSTVIQVLPLNPPQLQSPTLVTNGFQFQLFGQNNAYYYIFYATNLLPPVAWNYLGETTGTNGWQQYTDTNAPTGTRFYQIIVY